MSFQPELESPRISPAARAKLEELLAQVPPSVIMELLASRIGFRDGEIRIRIRGGRYDDAKGVVGLSRLIKL